MLMGLRGGAFVMDNLALWRGIHLRVRPLLIIRKNDLENKIPAAGFEPATKRSTAAHSDQTELRRANLDFDPKI